MADEDTAIETAQNGGGLRKRCKSSPRNTQRRSRRKAVFDQEDREFVDVLLPVKPRKKRHNSVDDKSNKAIKSISTPKTIEGGEEWYNVIGELIRDLVIWKDVSKSSLWFGFGSLCFLSSCFTKGVNFSIFSFLSQIGLLFLGVSFFSNSIRQRDDANGIKRDFKLREDDILKVGRLILPAANLAISKMRLVFSGEPAMTLKVVPFLLFGAEYGHLITLWRLCALGFFISFTGPKLYSAYSSQLCRKVEYAKSWALDLWGGCTYKRFVTGSAITAFWNLTSIRTRIFAAFLCVVVLRYRRQHCEANVEEDVIIAEERKVEEKHEVVEEKDDEKALVVVAVEIESNK